MTRTRSSFLLVVSLFAASGSLLAQEPAQGLPYYLSDRGEGQPTSMFGTYIRRAELLVYPFFEYYVDNNLEYKPEELGYGLDEDFRGRYRASEGLLFVAYGLTDRLAIELEAAVITASLETSQDDPSGIPARIEESGLGDVEGQLRFRWNRENRTRPEFFSYLEAVAPNESDTGLIGTADWEFKFGTGLVKGFRWGTMTFRAAAEYSEEESKVELGEYAVEYLKRLSRSWRVYLGVEGNQDEVELITEAQWHISDSVFVKINNGFGISSKATDWAPEIGVVFSFPPRR